jgi:hypothetical protein
VLVPTIVPPVRVVTVVVVMAVVTVMMVMAMMTVMMVMTVMTMTAVVAAVMAAAVHPVAAAVTTTVAAAVTAGFSTGDGERRQADNNRCGKGEQCSALEHVSGSLGCTAGAHPRSRTLLSLKPRLRTVPAITRWSNPGRTVRDRPNHRQER